MSAPFGGMPTRWDPDGGPSTRVALIVPGAGYSPAHPLLEFCRQSLSQHGWTVQQLWWDQPPGEHTVDERAGWVGDQVRSALDADATHFMHVPGDAVRSAQIHVEVTRVVDGFLGRLPADR